VTRHDLRSANAATEKLRRIPSSTTFTKISANVLDISRGQISMLDRGGDESHPPSSRQLQRRAGFAITATE
jgi:hypothetical protein